MPLVGYFVTRKMGLARIYPYTKFEVSDFTRSRFMEWGLKSKFWPWTLTTPFLRYFVTSKTGLARIYPTYQI